MSRHNRPNYEGAIYHVTNRGNRKQTIFEDDQDRLTFIRILTETQSIYGVKTLASTLMSNHFHLTLLTPHGNLSEFMQQLEGQYARYYNWRHKRVGHLFQGRFRHVLIEHDLHLLTACCYIFMNPVVAGLTKRLEDYRWSTFAPTVGLKPVPDYLTVDWLEALYPTLSVSEAQGRFRQLMCEPRPAAAYLEECELNVSDETIGEVIRSYTGEQLRLASVPKPYRTALRPGLEDLRATLDNDRIRLIIEARVAYGYRNAEIAKVLQINPGTVSRLFRKAVSTRSI